MAAISAILGKVYYLPLKMAETAVVYSLFPLGCRNTCSLDHPVVNERLVCADVVGLLSAMLNDTFTLFCGGQEGGVVGKEGPVQSDGVCMETGYGAGSVTVECGRRGVGEEREQIATLLCSGLTLMKLMR